MGIWQGQSRRKFTGGRRRYARKKRKFEIGRELQEAGIAERRVKIIHARGNTVKFRVLSTNYANITDKEKNTTSQVKIIQVVENPANIHYVRRNIITRGAVIETEIGNAVVTSRPGQHGIINAILLKKTES